MSDLSFAASLIRTIPDWPTPGVTFKDVTPLLADPKAMKYVVNAFAETGKDCDLVVGIEARGFIFASAVANELGKGFVPIRKKGKLPFKTYEQEYQLEYGRGVLEIHQDALSKGQRALLIDDILATGGTLIGAINLLNKVTSTLPQISVLMEIEGLQGKNNLLSNYPNLALNILVSLRRA